MTSGDEARLGVRHIALMASSAEHSGSVERSHNGCRCQVMRSKPWQKNLVSFPPDPSSWPANGGLAAAGS